MTLDKPEKAADRIPFELIIDDKKPSGRNFRSPILLGIEGFDPNKVFLSVEKITALGKKADAEKKRLAKIKHDLRYAKADIHDKKTDGEDLTDDEKKKVGQIEIEIQKISYKIDIIKRTIEYLTKYKEGVSEHKKNEFINGYDKLIQELEEAGE